MAHPEGGPDYEHLVSHFHGVGISEACDDRPYWRFLELKQGEVRSLIGGQHFRRKHLAVLELHENRIRGLDQVRGRDDLPVSGNQDTGAHPGQVRVLFIWSREDLPMLGFDDHDRGIDPLEDVCQRIGLRLWGGHHGTSHHGKEQENERSGVHRSLLAAGYRGVFRDSLPARF